MEHIAIMELKRAYSLCRHFTFPFAKKIKMPPFGRICMDLPLQFLDIHIVFCIQLFGSHPPLNATFIPSSLSLSLSASNSPLY